MGYSFKLITGLLTAIFWRFPHINTPVQQN